MAMHWASVQQMPRFIAPRSLNSFRLLANESWNRTANSETAVMLNWE
jgi:hypothetical protein